MHVRQIQRYEETSYWLPQYQQLKIQIELQTTDGILMEPSGLNVWDISETQCSPRPNLLSMTKCFLPLADPFIAAMVGD